jgi:hypothetical protein
MTSIEAGYGWLDPDAVAGDSYVPALDTLAQHKESLHDDLRAGFTDIRDVLLWQHAVSTATLGHVDSEWLPTVVTNRWQLATMLADADRREAITPNPPSPETAQSERLRVFQYHLLPAFNDAQSILRNRAGDYSDQGPVEDVDRQQFVAMRPRLHQRAVDQHAVLKWAVGLDDRPLTTHEDLLLWVSDLQDATDGFLPEGFADRVTARLGHWWDALLSEAVGCWLLSLLAQDVLPVMNEALADAAERSNEKSQTPPRAQKIPQG